MVGGSNPPGATISNFSHVAPSLDTALRGSRLQREGGNRGTSKIQRAHVDYGIIRIADVLSAEECAGEGMKTLLVILWFILSTLLLLIAVALAYVSVMMGAVHWDWWLSLGLGAGFLAVAIGCFWMCRRSLRLLRAKSRADLA